MQNPVYNKSYEPLVSMRDLIGAFADAMNLIDPEVEDHHERVSYLALQLANELGFTAEQKRLTFYGALFHDVGTIIFGEMSLAEVETNHAEKLARAGRNILQGCEVTSALSNIVDLSVFPRGKLRDSLTSVLHMPRIPQVIHLADLVAQHLDEHTPALNQITRIRQSIQESCQHDISVDVRKAFLSLCDKEIIWMELLYRPQAFLDFIPGSKFVTMEEVLDLTRVMSRIIDYRSPFTAMHSAGVAASAVFLAQRLDMDESSCRMMQIAGNLHDIGKLRIPSEILEKPGKLTDEEFNIMKEHAYYTFAILKNVRGFEQIARWAALHHEKLDGSGYPFHIDRSDLPLGSRIMAVADIFSAITEDRPYRKGMEKDRAIDILRGDAERGLLSEPIVALLIEHYDEINAVRQKASESASLNYRQMQAAQ